LIRCNDNAEFKVLKEFREKLRYLKNEVFHTFYTVLKKYKRLFVEPESMGCKSSVKHKIVTGTYLHIKKPVPFAKCIQVCCRRAD
jgi:predicted membrane-bound spermidine synthase